MTSAGGAAEGLAPDGGSLASQAAGRAAAASTAPLTAPARGDVTDMFARSVRDFARQHPGKPVKLLRAGCTGPIGDLGLDLLRADGTEVSLRSIDEDHPLIRQATAAAANAGIAGLVTLGDLRTIPLPSREFGIVCCAHLLDRVEHAELVLDRLVAALRPGGLLLLQLRDRDCAAGLLDRMLPALARRAVWHWLRPEQEGPFPAVYGPLLSSAGVHGYLQVRGLMIAEWRAVRDRPRRPVRLAWGAPLACRMIAALSRGRHTDDHDDLLYVIRKPESRFARVV
jgi:SAM-dependent methyltransferase